MTDRIRRTVTLSEREQSGLFRWSQDPFDIMHLDLEWRPKDLHFLLDRDGRTVSHVGLLKHIVRVDDSPVAVAGVGGVVTLPEVRHQGCATTLMSHAMQFVETEWQVAAGLLFCLPRMVTYYRGLGWRVLEEEVEIEQPRGAVASPLPVMVAPIGQFAWPPGRVQLDSRPW